jgi:hypothetical protein
MRQNSDVTLSWDFWNNSRHFGRTLSLVFSLELNYWNSAVRSMSGQKYLLATKDRTGRPQAVIWSGKTCQLRFFRGERRTNQL